MYTWFRKGKAAVTSGSDIVRFTGATLTTDPTKPVVGDAFTIDGISLYEVIVIDSDNTGEFIKLQKPYVGSTNSSIDYAIIRLASSTQNNKLVAMAAAAINQKQISLDDMYEWYTSEADTVDFLGPDDTIVTLKTYHKLTQEISDVGGNAGSITIVATNIDKVVNVSNNMSSVIAAPTAATQAASSAAEALASKNAAASSETSAASSASSALASKNAASTSETNALSSKNSAATSATNAANSATAALASKNAAATSETNAASSAASALASKNAAAISETNAAASAFQSFAMSQAQFEAIRAQNNEEFAASGFVHFGKHGGGGGDIAVNQGLYINPALVNSFRLGRPSIQSPIGLSKFDLPIINMAGITFYLDAKQDAFSGALIKFPQAPDGKTTYNKSTGVITNHATVTAAFNAQAADPTNVEVVTDRVDMWGFEAWLEEVSTTNPYIYPNGLIQSQSTTMDGIATSASARPVTYYAVFDGDIDSKGKGLNFFALTDAQKKNVLANPKNNLYYLDDGRLVQWRLRQRTIAGAGNGDWVNINSASASPELKFSNSVKIQAQGFKNTTTTSGTSVTTGGFIANGYITAANQLGDLYNSIFTVTKYNSPATDFAVNGQCYFLVCGTVNRLNQGAYHPSFNPSGAGRLNAANLVGTGAFWYSSSVINPSSMVECFKILSADADSTTAGVCSGTGAIGGYAVSGRPDGRYYDAIYADGQGGVCRDMRYSAYGVDSVDFAEADQRVKNGTYRGFGKTVFTSIRNSQMQTVAVGAQGLAMSNTGDYSVGDYWHLISPTDGVVQSGVITRINLNTGVYADTSPVFNRKAEVYTIVLSKPQSSSVGGSFLQTDVIGNPLNILATPALANGWQGSWIPVIPDGTTKEFLASRKNISAVGRVSQYTTNNGGSWATGSWNINGVTNSTSSFEPANRITIVTYQAFAKQTENTVNAVVYGRNAGVGGLIATSDSFLPEQNRGVLLKESLTGGKRGISGYSNGAVQGLNLTQFTLVSDKLLSGRSAYDSVHPPILIDGNTSVDAVKALNYNVNINQQAFIQYAYTELKHNGTNWGDDGKVTIVDNQATKTDLNGNTVLVGTAKLKEPIGWIKNKV